MGGGAARPARCAPPPGGRHGAGGQGRAGRAGVRGRGDARPCSLTYRFPGGEGGRQRLSVRHGAPTAVKHLLVTNDFPPKVGGIQSYLWELWRRLPPDDVVVFTTPYAGTETFDAEQKFRVIRSRQPVLLPIPGQARRIDAMATEVGADLVVLDPALPLGLVGPSLRHPYAVVLHGAEVTVPGRLPVTRQLLDRVLRDAVLVVAAGGYPAAEGRNAAGSYLPPVVVVPPGVDVDRFRPADRSERAETRRRYGLPVEGTVVLALTRLVPRKGVDVLIDAVSQLAPSRPDVVLAVAGGGRDRPRLERRAERRGL